MGLQDAGWPAYRPWECPLSPAQPFGKALGDFVETLTDKKRKLTQERVDSVLEDGRVNIRGTILPVTGRVPIIAGETVVVAWRDNKMELVMLNQGRRAGGAALNPLIALPVVEELFIATRPADGVRDVFFRNADQCRPLLVDSFGITPSQINTVKWGPGNDRFYIQQGANVYHIMKFNRRRFTPFDKGTNAAQKLSRERTENVATNTMTLCTFLISPDGFPQTTVITPNSPSTQRVSISLAIDGSLIGTFRVLGLYAVAGASPPAGLISTTGAFTGQPGVLGTTSYPIVADLTHGQVLLSAFDNPTLFEPFFTLFDLNNGTRSPAFYFPLTTFNAVFRPTTWIQANTFSVGSVPDVVNVTWWVGYSQTASSILPSLEPILVLGADLSPEQRVMGWVAWAQFEYLVAVGQTNDRPDIALNQFFPPTQPSEFIQFPAPPFPVTNQSIALAHPVVTTDGVTQALFALQRPLLGFAYAPTYHRVVWKQPTGGGFTPSDGGLNSGGDTAGFVRRFKTQATTQITTALRTTFGRHAVNVLPVDFVYQLDNPTTALPANAARDYFIKAWTFKGATAVPKFDLGIYPEDTALTSVKALAPIPRGVTQPTGLGNYALQIVNARDSLQPLGAFDRVPGTRG